MMNPFASRRESDERAPLDRRSFLALGMGGLVLASVPVAIASSKRRVVSRTVPVMATIAEIRVVVDGERDVPRAEAAIEAALEELYAVDRAMTRFSRHSEVGRANLEAARQPVGVGAATAAVVERALHWASCSGGAFDPCMGEVSDLWDVRHRHEPPAQREVRRFAGRSLYTQLEVGRRSGSAMLYYHTADIGLDLGGIAKGWSVDRAAAALRARGIRDALVNVAGHLYAIGQSERGDAWEIGVQSPTDPNGIVARFALTDAAVATSGDYRQYFDYKGRRFHHIMDPRTGEPRLTGEHSVSVRAERCIDADAGATAVFGAPPEKARAMLAAAAPDARLIHSI